MFARGFTLMPLILSLALLGMDIPPCMAQAEYHPVQRVNLHNLITNDVAHSTGIYRALSDNRYMRRQIRCVLGWSRCDLTGRTLRSMAPIAVRTGCAGCSEIERRLLQVVVRHLKIHFPWEWSQIVKKYS